MKKVIGIFSPKSNLNLHKFFNKLNFWTKNRPLVLCTLWQNTTFYQKINLWIVSYLAAKFKFNKNSMKKKIEFLDKSLDFVTVWVGLRTSWLSIKPSNWLSCFGFFASCDLCAKKQVALGLQFSNMLLDSFFLALKGGFLWWPLTTKTTVFKNLSKSLISQLCERSEQRLFSK